MVGAKSWTSVAGVVLAVALLVGGCSSSSGGTGSAGASSGTASKSLSEDDPLNTTSTKDMSTVTATVEGTSSPYFHSLPDLCPRIPDSAVTAAGFDPSVGRSRLAPEKTTSLIQTCGFTAVDEDSGDGLYSGGVAIAADNVKQFLSQPGFHVTQEVAVGPHNAYVYSSPISTSNSCAIVYGTFFGIAFFRASGNPTHPIDPCPKAIQIARSLYPYVPTRPSEMSAR